MSRIVGFEGKKYPRPGDRDFIYLSEVLARTRAVKHVLKKRDEKTEIGDILIHVNATDVSEGVEPIRTWYRMENHYQEEGIEPKVVMMKQNINWWLQNNNLPQIDAFFPPLRARVQPVVESDDEDDEGDEDENREVAA